MVEAYLDTISGGVQSVVEDTAMYTHRCVQLTSP